MNGEAELKQMVARIIDLAKLLAEVDHPRTIDSARTEKPGADQSDLKRSKKPIAPVPNPANRQPKT